MEVSYYLDGVDLKQYGVFIEGSDGLLSKPKKKKPFSNTWNDYHGEVIDLTKIYYESRDIALDCFIKAEDKAEFIMKCNTFLSLFDQPNTRRLAVTVDGSEPLVFEVYSEDLINVKKKWSETTMIGTIQLKLKEPEPIKKVIKYQRTGTGDKTVSITVTSTKLLNIYWGDGAHTFDVSGTSQTITHDYSENGIFYIVITGDIDAITSLTTTGTVVWNKL
jgi:hypothetical protein